VKIALVNLPFTTVRLPSLALAQLAARVRSAEPERVEVKTFYLNHDFAGLLGVDDYEVIANDLDVYHTGFGDWLFRQAAFPELPDNRVEYLERHYRAQHPLGALARRVTERRAELDALFDRLIEEHDLAGFDLVGSSAVFAQTVASIALARKLKRLPGKRVLVIGGAACEGPMGRALARNTGVFDHVFSGGALVSFVELVRDLLDARPPRRLSGVYAAGRLALAQDSLGEELDINEVVEPDYDDYLRSFESRIGGNRRPTLLFETSRGY